MPVAGYFWDTGHLIFPGVLSKTYHQSAPALPPLVYDLEQDINVIGDGPKVSLAT